jgi:transcriptional regulator with XRE-family HTH domain
MARTRNIADVIKAKLAADHELATSVAEEYVNAQIAQQVYELRTAAKLTQKDLAERIGTQQSVISRIEDADYEGHSLGLLKRIAEALGKKLRIEFCEPEAKEVAEKPATVTTSKVVTIVAVDRSGGRTFVSDTSPRSGAFALVATTREGR